MNASNWRDSTGVSLSSRPNRRMNEFKANQVNVKQFKVNESNVSQSKSNQLNANKFNETKMNTINSLLITDRRSGLADRSVARSVARSAANINKLRQQNEPNKPTGVCSTCGMPLVARFATKGKHCARCLTDAQATLHNGRPVSGPMKSLVKSQVKSQVNAQVKSPANGQVNGQVKVQVNSPANGPMNSLVNSPMNGQVNGQSKNDEKSPIDRIEKPKIRKRKSKKLITQQSNQIHQQSSHIIQRNPSSLLVSVGAMNKIHSNRRDSVVSGQACEKASRPDDIGPSKESRSNEDSRSDKNSRSDSRSDDSRPDSRSDSRSDDNKPDSRSKDKPDKPNGNREAKIRSNPIEVVSSQVNGAQTKVQSRFSWKGYLKETNSLAAPLKCFKPNQTFNNKPNYFKAGMKLEAIDPNHPSLFCVATVVEVCGFRMRIHLDQYSSQFDFWVR